MSAVTFVRRRLLRRELFILAARMVVEGNIMTTSCLSTALVLVLSATFTSACNADKPAEPTKFKAIALVLRDDVYRLWIMPESDDACSKKMEAGYFPGQHVPELGLLILRGAFRSMDVSVESLADHKELLSIDLSFTEIQDRDLVPVGKCEQLRQLVLDHTQVTDKGLQHLRTLANLRLLNLVDTRVTQEAIEELRRIRPTLTVETERMGKIEASAPGCLHIDVQTPRNR